MIRSVMNSWLLCSPYANVWVFIAIIRILLIIEQKNKTQGNALVILPHKNLTDYAFEKCKAKNEKKSGML